MTDETRSHQAIEGPSLPDTYQLQDAERPNSRLEGLRRDNAGVYAYLMSVVREDEKRRLLAALVNHGGTTYDNLEDTVSLTRRRMRSNVYDLAEKGVVEVTDSHVSFVHFADEDMRLLAEDALSFFFE